MNKQYIRGRAKEYQAKNELQKEGYTVCRMSGSHSPFDLVAFNNYQCRHIQLKLTKSTNKFYKEIRKLEQVQTSEYCDKELWIWRHKKGWDKSIIFGIGKVLING